MVASLFDTILQVRWYSIKKAIMEFYPDLFCLREEIMTLITLYEDIPDYQASGSWQESKLLVRNLSDSVNY